MGNEQKLLIRNGIEKTGIPVERKSRIFVRACAPILVAALAVGNVVAGCENGKKDDSAALLGAVEAAVRERANSNLYKGAKNGNMRQVQKALAEGADANYSNVLAQAAVNGNANMVELLIKKGADPNKIAKDGTTPLMHACTKNRLNAAKILLAYHADPNAKTTKEWAKGFTPLMMAATEGRIEIVKMLIAHGADVNAKSEEGWTALIGACSGNHVKTAEFLLENWAEKEAEYKGYTALDWASEENRPGIVNLLIKKGAINRAKPLRLAAMNGNLKIVRALMKDNAWTDFGRDEDDNTPLILAAKGNHTETALFLLKEGAWTDSENARGQTALMIAAGKRNIRLVEALIKEGADVMEEDDNGRTAIDYLQPYSLDESTYPEAKTNAVRDILIKNGAAYKTDS